MSAILQSTLSASAASSLLGSTASTRSAGGQSTLASNGLTALLAASNSIGDGVPIESVKVRVAKAQFTAPYFTPPWLNQSGQPAPNPNLSAIKGLKSLVDSKADSALPADLREAFTTYRALDKLRVVAEAASSATTGTVERASLAGIFEHGLADLRKFLSGIAPDKLNLYFEAPSRVAISSPIRQGASVTTSFLKGAVDTRTAALTSLDGATSIKLSIRKGSSVFPVNVDLSEIDAPPTLDKIARALNTAFAAYSASDSNGNPLVDANGNPISLLLSKFSVTNTNGKWGLSLQSVPNEAVWSLPPQSTESLLVIGKQTAGKDMAPVQIRHIDNFAVQARPRLTSTIAAIDADATARARLADSKAPEVAAAIDIASAVTDADGNTYLLGTTAGAVDNITAAGSPEIFIRKVAPSGVLIWQRPIDSTLDAQASALSMGKDGKLVVAGSLIGGSKEIARTDGNLFAARFDLDGAQISQSSVNLPGNQQATAVTGDASGNTYVTTRNGVTGSGLYKFDATGKLVASTTSASNKLVAVQIAPDSTVIVLGRGSDGMAFVEQFNNTLVSSGNTLNLGDLQPADMAIADDGTIAISGTVFKPGNSDKDAVVSLIDSDLTAEQRIVLGTTGTEDADSLIYANNAFYLAGRTTGDLDGQRTGLVDGFISKIDAETGAIAETLQFGRPDVSTGPVVVAKSLASSPALESIGLGTGLLTPARDSKLVDTTRLRAGDTFQFKLDGGKVQTVKIEAADTLSTLATRIRKSLGKAVTVTTTMASSGMTLRIQPTTGHALQLFAGPADSDALEKLGLKAVRLFAPPPPSAKDPKVKPGGQYGLAMSDSLSVASQNDAKQALVQVKAALSMTQTAFRSLYWDDSMVAKVEGRAALTSTQASQLQQYRAAIARLGG